MCNATSPSEIICTSPVVNSETEKNGIQTYVPGCYREDQLDPIAATQIVWFDKMHHKQQVGPTTINSKHENHIVLPTLENGTIDNKKGTYQRNNLPVRSTFKFPQEARFCLGVAKVELNSENDCQQVFV
jgi:outer membrane receptor for Fe3+-dicitrate